MLKHTVLIAEDEVAQRSHLGQIVQQKLGYEVVLVKDGQEAIDYLLSGRQPIPDMMLLDLSLPRLSGVEVIRSVRPLRPHLPIIVLTMYGGVESAVEAVKAGADDFLAKPVGAERLEVSIKNVLRLSLLSHEVERLERNSVGRLLFSDIIGVSSAAKEMIALGQKAATLEIPLLLDGEPGTGKELLARAIHGSSNRAGKAFLVVNAATLAEDQLEVTLFGQQSADGNILPGKCMQAEGGTLYIKGVDHLRPALQVKLLKVIQEELVQPAGSRVGLPCHVRIIASATTRLQQLVEQGDFRQDLYCHLQAFCISVPALRDRREDVDLLAEHFLQRFAIMENKPVRQFNAEAMKILTTFSWPDNVRQLQNAIFRAVVMAEGISLEPTHFAHLALMAYSKDAITQQWAARGDGITSLAAKVSQSFLPLTDVNGNLRRMVELEAELIKFALRYYDGHMSEIARRLGIGRSTLYRKIHDFGIESERPYYAMATSPVRTIPHGQ